MSQQRQPGLGGWGVGKRQALALEPASPFSRPGRPAWVTALALMSENAFLELAGPGRSRVSPSSSLFLSCPHTRPFFFFFFSLQNQNTALSRVQELRPNGRSQRGRLQVWDTTRELPRPGVVLLGAAEFGFSPSGFKCHCSREQEFKVVAPGGGGGGNGLCPPLPPKSKA